MSVFSFLRSSRLVIDDPPSLTIWALMLGTRSNALWRSAALVRESRRVAGGRVTVSAAPEHEAADTDKAPINTRRRMESQILARPANTCGIVDEHSQKAALSSKETCDGDPKHPVQRSDFLGTDGVRLACLGARCWRYRRHGHGFVRRRLARSHVDTRS